MLEERYKVGRQLVESEEIQAKVRDRGESRREKRKKDGEGEEKR